MTGIGVVMGNREEENFSNVAEVMAEAEDTTVVIIAVVAGVATRKKDIDFRISI